MTKKQKLEIILKFDNPAIRAAMTFFFKTYEQQLPLFIKDQLGQIDQESDPSIIIKDNEVVFKSMNKDKGYVFIPDEELGIKALDYKLVPNDTGYVIYENGRLAIFFKRDPKTPDVRIGEFPNFDMMVEGIGQIEDPIKVLAEAEAKVAEVEAERAEEEPQAEMEVVKDKE